MAFNYWYKNQEMKLSTKQLELIRANISDINIDLNDWNYGRAVYKNENETIESAKYYISFDLQVVGDAVKLGCAGFMEEQSYSEPTFQKDILTIDLWDPDGDKVELTDKQKHLIELSLLSNIYAS